MRYEIEEVQLPYAPGVSGSFFQLVIVFPDGRRHVEKDRPFGSRAKAQEHIDRLML